MVEVLPQVGRAGRLVPRPKASHSCNGHTDSGLQAPGSCLNAAPRGGQVRGNEGGSLVGRWGRSWHCWSLLMDSRPSHSHLAQNPFVCDCHLKWLADYLQDNPIETSGARCSSPRRLANKRISQIKSKKFRCSGNQVTAGPHLLTQSAAAPERPIIQSGGQQAL